MRRDASWLLRRFADGGAPDWRVEEALGWEFDALIDRRAALAGESSGLRRTASEQLREFDEATNRALQWRKERRFKEALLEIRRAQVELAKLQRIVTVELGLARTLALIEEIDALVESPLHELPTLGILRRLQRLAREFLDQGQPRPANFVIFLLTAQVDRLRSREHGRATSPEPISAPSERPRSGAAAESLKRLSREGYFHLADRLSQDLDTVQTVEERARRASEAQGPMGALVEEMKRIREQADSARRSLAAWLESAAPASTP